MASLHSGCWISGVTMSKDRPPFQPSLGSCVIAFLFIMTTCRGVPHPTLETINIKEFATTFQTHQQCLIASFSSHVGLCAYSLPCLVRCSFCYCHTTCHSIVPLWKPEQRKFRLAWTMGKPRVSSTLPGQEFGVSSSGETPRFQL